MTKKIDLPSMNYLDEQGIPYAHRSFPPTIEKGAANVANALGFRERQMVKTLLFERAARRNPGPSGPGEASSQTSCGKELAARYRSGESPSLQEGVLQTDQGEAALIMVGGDQNVVSGRLKKILGSRNISMCSRERVKAITGYEVGSIPPFHWQPPHFRSFIDVSLMQETVLGVGTGQWGEEILIQPEYLVKASHASIVNLTERIL